MKWKAFLLILSGITLYDGINHLFLAIKNSPYSVHGLFVGVTGNYLIAMVDIIITIALLISCRNLLSDKRGYRNEKHRNKT